MKIYKVEYGVFLTHSMEVLADDEEDAAKRATASVYNGCHLSQGVEDVMIHEVTEVTE